MSSAAPKPFVLERVEAPQIVYPKGPIREIRSSELATDAVAGLVTIAVLEPCGHPVTLACTNVEDVIVRCPQCFYERHRAAGESEHHVDDSGDA